MDFAVAGAAVAARRSADLTRLPGPVLGPQHFLVDLADGGERQTVDELDLLCLLYTSDAADE